MLKAKLIGSWNYDRKEMNLIHGYNSKWEEHIIPQAKHLEAIALVKKAIDLSEYYSSTEWDLMRAPGIRHEWMYPCCPNGYVDITYYLVLRRKTGFYVYGLPVFCIYEVF